MNNGTVLAWSNGQEASQHEKGWVIVLNHRAPNQATEKPPDNDDGLEVEEQHGATPANIHGVQIRREGILLWTRWTSFHKDRIVAERLAFDHPLDVRLVERANDHTYEPREDDGQDDGQNAANDTPQYHAE
jgi:hypothetical protein